MFLSAIQGVAPTQTLEADIVNGKVCAHGEN